MVEDRTNNLAVLGLQIWHRALVVSESLLCRTIAYQPERQQKRTKTRCQLHQWAESRKEREILYCCTCNVHLYLVQISLLRKLGSVEKNCKTLDLAKRFLALKRWKKSLIVMVIKCSYLFWVYMSIWCSLSMPCKMPVRR